MQQFKIKTNNFIFLLLILPFIFAGCAVSPGSVERNTQTEWNVRTIYEVHDIRSSDEIRRALRTRIKGGEEDPYGFVEYDVVTPYTFHLTKITNMEQLRQVQDIISNVTKEHKIPVDLKKAILKFQSIEGTARAYIKVVGEATSGATVYLDTGELMYGGARRVITISVEKDGMWTHSLERNDVLGNRNGVIYGVVEIQGTKKIIKMNVLKKGDSINISAEDLPDDSILRSYLKK